jgi:hypothetical protein
VRVVLPHHVTDDAGALREAAIRPVAAVVHRVEHPSMHRLETVAYVRESSLHDDRHRVVEVRPLHLDLQVDRLDAATGTRVERRKVGGVCHGKLLLEGYVGTAANNATEQMAIKCPRTGRPWRCAG